MTSYNELRKIIPADQALANQALSRSLRQVKDIFNTDLPSVARAVSQLETNKDLDLINALETPLPPLVSNVWGNTFATGTGPGNSITLNDVIGTASGAVTTEVLPQVTLTVQELANAGALNNLTANGGTPSSAINGVYTVMQYCLNGDYTTAVQISPGNIGPPPTPPEFLYTITIPPPLPAQGTYGPELDFRVVIDEAFTNLISIGNSVISNIANSYPAQANVCNNAANSMSQQLELNIVNCTSAGIDIANVVNDIANANLISNAVSVSLGLASRLHEIGLDVTEGGQAQFIEEVANTSNLTGQAVIASMREGRNIAVLNAVGIQLDTQIVAVNPDPQIANNLSNAQYTVAEARANVII
jgi:hypothetical protein